MGENELNDKEIKNGGDIGANGKKDEIEASSQNESSKEDVKNDEEISWDDAQKEVEASSQNELSREDAKSDEDIGWDDVKDELETSGMASQKREVSSVNFQELEKGDSVGAELDLNFILDLPLTLTAELGRTQLLIGELLQLGHGSVVELAKLTGEPMDIFVNNRLIARGEVVMVNDKYGVRLTDVVSPAERVNKLR